MRTSSLKKTPGLDLSVAMLVTIGAFMPIIVVIVPMMISIIVTFAWNSNASQTKADQSEYEGAVSNALRFC